MQMCKQIFVKFTDFDTSAGTKKSNPEGLLSPILTSWAGDDIFYGRILRRHILGICYRATLCALYVYLPVLCCQ